jgi:hypothetical protein
MRRSPQEVVDTLSYFLKEGKQGDEFKISELAKKTSMSYVTVSYYLDVIEHAQKNIPAIEVVEKPRNSYVKVLKEADLKFSKEEHILLFLFDKKAFSETSAVSVGMYQENEVSKLVDSFVSISATSKKAFLLTKGIIEAASLAGIRADAAISSKKGRVLEKGELEIEKWMMNSSQSKLPMKLSMNNLQKDFLQKHDNYNAMMVDVA